MALADIIRSNVAVAKSILDGGRLLVTIYQYPWTGHNEYGEPTFGPRVARKAVADSTTARIQTGVGIDTEASSKYTILDNITVDPRDHFSCPCPTTGVMLEPKPILRVERNVLDSSRQAFVVEVYL
jgi:hypothetical protein